MDLENINEKTSGVYRITCKKNNKNYIGISKDIKKRWGQHIRMLKNKKHHSSKLQKDYNKYGDDAFEFRVVELTEYGEAKKLEDEYIEKYDSYTNGYNCDNHIENVKGKDKIQCNNILEYIKDTYIPDGNVYCYNLFKIAEYLSIRVTDLLKFIGINSERKFNVYRYLDDKTLIGLNWSNENIFIEIINAKLYNDNSNFIEVDIEI